MSEAVDELDAELRAGADQLRAARKFLEDAFAEPMCREGPPFEGCLSCQSIHVIEGLDRFINEIDRLTAPSSKDSPQG